jgi:CubicO group peptidase (beta-lactamase class C family)
VLAGAACRKAEEDPGVAADTKAKAGRALRDARVPGIGYAVVTRERVSSGGVGVADEGSQAAVDGETVFEAASIAKTVIAACVMQLVEEGRLDLDADLGTYVGFAVRHPHYPEPITLRMALTHRASLRDRQDELVARREDATLAVFLERYVRGARTEAFLDARPGTSTSYSNVGAALAALAVERVAGESFGDHATRRIFVPLRMTRSGWTADRGTAAPHAHRDGRFVALPQPSHAVYPVVDLRSSAHDLARFARTILREGELDGARVLSAASVRAMLAADAGDADQALTWQLRTIGGRRVAGHEGEDAGATTALFLDRAAGTGVVVLANGDAFGARAAAIQALLSDLLATDLRP